MLIRKLQSCTEIIAGDGTRLRELVHPFREYSFSGRYSLAHAVLPVGEQSLRHRLSSSEVYYILAGQGIMHIDKESAEVEPGDTIEIPSHSIQWLENTGNTDLVFLCIVDPAWKEDDEEILS